MTIELLTVPDLGGAEQVEVIEILVSTGDKVEAEESVIVLETDKATMEIPSPLTGTISSLTIKVGDKVNEGDEYGAIETSEADTKPNKVAKVESVELKDDVEPEALSKSEPSQPEQSPEIEATRVETIPVPDLGGSEQVEVIELLVKVGEEVDAEQSVLTLETDKASMEIPAGKSGRVEKILLTLGDKVSVGDAMIELLLSQASNTKSTVENEDSSAATNTSMTNTATTNTATTDTVTNKQSASAVKAGLSSAGGTSVEDVKPSGQVHAGPAVRKLAREFGVDLALVAGSGTRGRVTKDDVQNHVKVALQNPQVAGGSGIPKVAEVDFSKFGETEVVTLNKIKLATAKNLTAAWLNAPQVTQFDQADISELEAFRKQVNAKPNVEQKLSAVPFVMKALATAMKEYPQFNASLSADGQSLIYKKYTNIGVAVDTPGGLLVPVIRDVDQKTVTEIAQDLNQKAQKAREGKLGLVDMQGGCLSVSSLGGIGGTAFTPIVNAPEVAILGLSRAEIKPMWNGSDFVPKLMLPLSLSYDHRVIDGAEAARFSQRLAELLGDIRHLVL